MKTICKASLMALPGLLLLCLDGLAQDLAKKTDTTVVKKDIPFDINLQLRSNYIWRGFKYLTRRYPMSTCIITSIV